MKAFIFILLATAGLNLAHAKPSALFNVKTKRWTPVIKSEDPLPPQVPEEPMEPIRTAAVKVSIMKWELKKLPDGTYDYNATPVCIKSGIANVYDLRSSRDGFVSNRPIECESTLNGEPVQIATFSSVYLISGKVHPDEGFSDTKATSTFAFILSNSGGTDQAELLPFSEHITRELGATSNISKVYQSQDWVCSGTVEPNPTPVPEPVIPFFMGKSSGDDSQPPTTCVPTRTEGFYITTEITDTP